MIVPHFICKEGLRQDIFWKHSEICPNDRGGRWPWTLNRITGEGCQIVKRMVTNGERSVRKLSRAVHFRSPISRSASRRLRKSRYCRPIGRSPSYSCSLHSHGGTGCGSTHNPFLASRHLFLSGIPMKHHLALGIGRMVQGRTVCRFPLRQAPATSPLSPLA